MTKEFVRDISVGKKRGSEWGTPVEPGTDDGVRCDSFSPPTGGRKTTTNAAEFGQGMETVVTPHEFEEQSASMSLTAYYEGPEKYLAYIMGQQLANTEIVPSKAYLKTYVLNPAMAAIFSTIAWDEGEEVKRFNSAIMKSLDLSVSDGIKIGTEYIGDKVEVAAGFTKPMAVTYEGSGEDALRFIDAKVFVNDATAGDFVTSDEVNLTNLNIKIERGYESGSIESGKDTISIPKELNVPTCNVTAEFASKDTKNAAFFTAFNNQTAKKMKVVFTGRVFEATHNFEIAFYFPKIMFFEAPTYDISSGLKVSASLKALKAANNPTGMTQALPYITVKNSLNKTYL